MIYMVEMALDDRAREAEWHAWYLSHIRKLLAVPGFNASQRFAALHDTPSPFLALHEVASAALFESREYRAVGGPSGTGEWQHRMSNWHRNLYEGLEATPEVAPHEFLLVVDEGGEGALPPG